MSLFLPCSYDYTKLATGHRKRGTTSSLGHLGCTWYKITDQLSPKFVFSLISPCQIF